MKLLFENWRNYAASIIDESGIGVFDKNKLQKKLSGKLVSLTPYISEQREGLTGESTPEDMSTLMKLVYLYFTSPRRDSIAYEGLMTQMKTLVINKGKSPEANFQDTIEATLAQYHPRRIPLNMERMGKINFNDAWEIYNERFSDASDFTFIFVGNISSEELKPLLESYIASLPAKNRKETPKDLGVKSPDKVVVKEIKKGIEPKSMVSVVFAGPMEWTQQNRFDLDVMIRVLSIKLRENLREDKGGVYGVRANASVEKYPKPSYRVNIGFGCAPENVETLTKAVFDEIAKLSKDGAQDKELQKVKETVLRERELQLKENDFWLSWLERCAWTQDDPSILFNYNKLVEGMNATSIQKTAASFLKTDRYVQVVMNPETK
jgi:zinc protease